MPRRVGTALRPGLEQDLGQELPAPVTLPAWRRRPARRLDQVRAEASLAPLPSMRRRKLVARVFDERLAAAPDPEAAVEAVITLVSDDLLGGRR